MSVTLVVDGTYGDVGKGKILSFLSNKDSPKCVVKSSGPNCGHTITKGIKKFGLRMLPGAVFDEKPRLLIGAGSLVNVDVLLKEIRETEVDPKRVGVDKRATLLTQKHIDQDKQSVLSNSIGSTLTGCSPCQADRAMRTAQLVTEDKRLAPFITDVMLECNKAESVLVEGAQGYGLGNLFGAYPNVTNRECTASSLCAEIGIGPRKVTDVVLVIKSFMTRVGAGPFPEQMSEEEAVKRGWAEKGVVTGRIRKISEYLDFDLIREAAMVNTATMIALTKLDARFPETKGLTDWNYVSQPAKDFVKMVEDNVGVPIKLIGTGPSVEEMIDLR